jgi:hypothetical protein
MRADDLLDDEVGRAVAELRAGQLGVLEPAVEDHAGLVHLLSERSALRAAERAGVGCGRELREQQDGGEGQNAARKQANHRRDSSGSDTT